MPFELSHFNVMEHLWETLDKTPDGKIRYHQLDIEQLWTLGFVDAAQVNLAEWEALFEPFRQDDGTFLLGRDDFLALDRHRYKGEVRIPFDAMEINEGRYTDEGLRDLIEASIAPSCGLARDELDKFFGGLMKDFLQPDGLILIRGPAKERIRDLLAEHPSPLRNLEILLDNMLQQRGDEMEERIDDTLAAAATAEAALQASHFSTSPVSRAEDGARGLKALEKSRAAAGPAADGAKVELKRIKRSRKGMRG